MSGQKRDGGENVESGAVRAIAKCLFSHFYPTTGQDNPEKKTFRLGSTGAWYVH